MLNKLSEKDLIFWGIFYNETPGIEIPQLLIGAKSNSFTEKDIYRLMKRSIYTVDKTHMKEWFGFLSTQFFDFNINVVREGWTILLVAAEAKNDAMILALCEVYKGKINDTYEQVFPDKKCNALALYQVEGGKTPEVIECLQKLPGNKG